VPERQTALLLPAVHAHAVLQSIFERARTLSVDIAFEERSWLRAADGRPFTLERSSVRT
jgi:hypothetical protein